MRTKTTEGRKAGFRCERCHTWHKFPDYVFTNWDKDVVYTCGVCYGEYTICQGIAWLEVEEEME